MIDLVEWVDARGRNAFGRWFAGLDREAAASVAIAIERLADGNRSRVKSVGKGVAELKIDRGPGYRVYFGWDGRTLVVLLGGGTKRRQQDDIAAAHAGWSDYKTRKTVAETRAIERRK